MNDWWRVCLQIFLDSSCLWSDCSAGFLVFCGLWWFMMVDDGFFRYLFVTLLHVYVSLPAVGWHQKVQRISRSKQIGYQSRHRKEGNNCYPDCIWLHPLRTRPAQKQARLVLDKLISPRIRHQNQQRNLKEVRKPPGEPLRKHQGHKPLGKKKKKTTLPESGALAAAGLRDSSQWRLEPTTEVHGQTSPRQREWVARPKGKRAMQKGSSVVLV